MLLIELALCAPLPLGKRRSWFIGTQGQRDFLALCDYSSYILTV